MKTCLKTFRKSHGKSATSSTGLFLQQGIHRFSFFKDINHLAFFFSLYESIMMYERLNLSPLTTIPLTLQLRPCPDGAPSEHNGQIAFPRLSLAGGESPHHNRGKLGGGRTSPELSPSQFATRHTTGGALPSLQLGQCGRFPMGQLPARAGGGDGG